MTYINKFNPKKNNRDRRLRPKRKESAIPQVTYVPIERKSAAGNTYVKYMAVYPKNPEGYNRLAVRAELSKRRRS